MKETIDCLLIGHNEMDINRYADSVKQVGEDSVTYRDLNYSFIQHNNKKFTFADIFNYVQQEHNPAFTGKDYLHMGNVFGLSIAYLGTYLHRHRLTFDYINSFQLQKNKLIDILQSKEILTIAITTTLYLDYYPIREIVSFIKKYNNTSKIIVGGPFVANKIKANPKASLYYFNIIGADIYVYSSQGEAALVNTINCLKQGGSLEKINNIYFKKDNEFTATRLKPENNNLEHNMVDWQLFRDDLPRLVNVRSAISCPFNCSFCGFPQRAGKYYTVPVEALERELNTLRDTNVKSVYIIDDTFNVPKARFKEILRMMIRNRYPFKWNSYFRCQFADRETLDLMAEAGCEGVNLGLESGNQQILKNMNKKVTIKAYHRGLKLLSQYDFLKLATFILGFPGETEQSVKDTVTLIEESGLDYVGYLLWFGDPITPIYREKERYQIKGSQFEWSHSTMDSETASNLLAEKFLSLKNATWGPPPPLINQLPFALYQKNTDFNQINQLIKCFNRGIAEKIGDSKQREKNISPAIFEKLRAAILNFNNGSTPQVNQIKNREIPGPLQLPEVQTALRITAESLGNEAYKKEYRLKYAYASGGMGHGIASKEMVVKMGKAGMIGYFGTNALALAEIREAILYIQNHLEQGQAYGMNLFNSSRENEIVDLFLKHNVRNIEASSYMHITPALVKYRLTGLKQMADGTISAAHRVMAKISRPETARLFLSPAPDRIVKNLLAEGIITREQARLGKRIPMADDLCAEADSGGPAGQGTPSTLIPAIIKLRDDMMEKYRNTKKVRVGAAGGIGTPEAAASAFILGADFILTGSINQCTAEAGISDVVKDLLQKINVRDTDYAPAGNMFEMGAKIRVLKKGVFFQVRANKLYDLYRYHNSLEEIDEKTQKRLQEQYFKRSFQDIYQEVKSQYPPEEIERAEGNPRHKMALVFKWYFDYTARLALEGHIEHKVDFQVHCGPALGAFNQWVKGTPWENWRNRHVDEIAETLMKETAALLNQRFQSMTKKHQNSWIEVF